MKDIRNYHADKYPKEGILGLFTKSKYKRVENGIFQTTQKGNAIYVTSLSFLQEPEFGEYDEYNVVSQYPLEDILWEFGVICSDFYDELNTDRTKRCYQEFSSPDIEEIRKLRTIIGKHVYNKSRIGEDGQEYVDLIIE